MKDKEKKVSLPSVDVLTRFYTIEQAKQELESFAKEKGINCQLFENGCDDVESGESPLWYIGAEIKIGERVRWISFQFNLFPTTAGCFGYQLNIMKMILERMANANIPFYDKCRGIIFDSRNNSLTADFCQSEKDVADCIRLEIDFIMSECGMSLFLSAHRMRCGGFAVGDDISSAIYSRNGKLILLKRVYVPSLEDIENSYNCWQRGQFIPDKVKNPNLDPKVRALFQPNSTHDRLEPQYLPNILSMMCKFTWRSSLGLTTNFAVTAALAEVLQMDGVEVLDSFHFPNFDNYYLCKWPEITPPIVMAVAFSVNGRKFVYHRNTNSDEFCIDEIGTSNKLVMMESFNNTNVGKIRSAICRFLGIQL